MAFCKQDRYKLRVLECCQEISMWYSGSSDLQNHEATRYYEFLKFRIETWQPISPIKGNLLAKYEKSVLDMCKLCVKLYLKRIKEFEE